MAACQVKTYKNNATEDVRSATAADTVADLVPDVEKLDADEEEHQVDEDMSYVVMSVDDEDVCNFDSRMSKLKENMQASRSRIYDNDRELLKINRIFREVAQALGVEWRQVFIDLMKTISASTETTETELKSLGLLRPLVQGYKALHVWRTHAEAHFSLDKLEKVLVENKHEDISKILHQDFNETQPDVEARKKLRNSITKRKSDASLFNSDNVDNRSLLLISKSIGADWSRLAHELNVGSEELKEIESTNTNTQEKAFKALWFWREAAPKNLAVLQLNGALGTIGRADLALS